MNISPTEAEEALAAIQTMMKKTRRAISSRTECPRPPTTCWT